MALAVTGVYQDGPLNSHLKLPVLVSFPTMSVLHGTYGKPDNFVENSYDWTDFYTYVLLRPGVSAAGLSAKLPAFMGRHYNDLPRAKSTGDSLSLSLMPVAGHPPALALHRRSGARRRQRVRFLSVPHRLLYYRNRVDQLYQPGDRPFPGAGEERWGSVKCWAPYGVNWSVSL